MVQKRKEEEWTDMTNDLETGVGRGLGLTQQQVAKFGAVKVVRESFKLLGGLHPCLVWILFALVIPYNLYLNVVVYAQLTIPNALLSSVLGPSAPPSTFSWDLKKWLAILLYVFLVILIGCLRLVIVGAVFYAVGSIFNGRNATFSEVVHAVPRLWSRLFVTAIVGILSLFSVVVVHAIFIVVSFFTVSYYYFLPVLPIFEVIFFIPLYIISLMYQVANGVTCFEEFYDMSAFRKGKHILHNKWGTAVRLSSILASPLLIVGFLMETPVKLTHEFHWRWLVLSIFSVIFPSYLTELRHIAWAVFYFSCALNYAQDTSFQRSVQLEAGYQSIVAAEA